MAGSRRSPSCLLGSAFSLPRSSRSQRPLYVWNASESVPLGLYRLRPADRLFVSELVAIKPPEPLASFLDLNGYLPIGIPMLKRVLALPGQTVCRSERSISVDKINMGEARERDSRCRSGTAVVLSARTNSFS